MPLEYGIAIPFEEQMAISMAGTQILLDLLLQHNIKATLYTTAQFAQHAPELMRRMVKEGHEIASHNMVHTAHEPHHPALSKQVLEDICQTEIHGFRMPRLQAIDPQVLLNAGYVYNSSLNPIWLPGRYNHLDKPRTLYQQDGLWQLPASVSPFMRFPLFWLSFHNLPLGIYQFLCAQTYLCDGYVNTYFHPWEFTQLDAKKFNFPAYVCRNTGEAMTQRLDAFIRWAKGRGFEFGTTYEWLSSRATLAKSN